MDIFHIIFGTISALAAIFGIAVTIRRLRQRYGLRWAALPPKSMMEIADEVAPSISISYKDRPVANLIRYQFILHNTGHTLLEQNSIVRAVTWKGPGTIISARVIETDPPVDLNLKLKGSELEISWDLFNQKCKALIELLCEGDLSESRGEISGQIKNVPRIEQKQIRWADEDKTTRFNRRLNYFVFPFILSSWVTPVLLNPNISWILRSTIFAAVVAIIILFILILKFRNPYVRILRKANQIKRTVQ